MTRLRSPVQFETAFATYEAGEILGEGGSGRVFAGVAADGSAVAIKLLSEDRASRDRRARFKNELVFLSNNKHPNIVTVIDHGLSRSAGSSGPFYVMPRYDCSLRQFIADRIPAERVLPLIQQLLDGVEAAHLQQVVHRDLKPENVLLRRSDQTLAVADFGVARFTEDLLATSVATAPSQRLANFAYAAPEQRAPGQPVGAAADLYALGLMVNELFTGRIPHGTDYATIGSVAPAFGYLDPLVAALLRQTPEDRPSSILEVKQHVQRYEAEAVALQRLSVFSNEVVPATSIDDPLATTPPQLVAADWNDGGLVLTLDRPVSPGWARAFQEMAAGSILGHGPETFSFHGNTAVTTVRADSVQALVDYFKGWLPVATRDFRRHLEEAGRRAETQRLEQLRRQREAEEERLRVLRSIKI